MCYDCVLNTIALLNNEINKLPHICLYFDCECREKRKNTLSVPSQFSFSAKSPRKLPHQKFPRGNWWLLNDILITVYTSMAVNPSVCLLLAIPSKHHGAPGGADGGWWRFSHAGSYVQHSQANAACWQQAPHVAPAEPAGEGGLWRWGLVTRLLPKQLPLISRSLLHRPKLLIYLQRDLVEPDIVNTTRCIDCLTDFTFL